MTEKLVLRKASDLTFTVKKEKLNEKGINAKILHIKRKKITQNVDRMEIGR